MVTSPKEPGKLEGLGDPLLDTGGQPTAGLMEAEHAALVLHFSFLAALHTSCCSLFLESARPLLAIVHSALAVS